MKVKVTRKMPEPISVPIVTEFIKLEALLKLVNVAGSGGMAKNMILNEEAKVNGEICTMRGKKLRSGDRFSFMGNSFVIVDAAE